MKRTVIFSTAMLIGLLTTGAAHAQTGSMTIAAIKGTYKCKFTAFGLPATVKDPFTQTASGDIELVADGAGHWSSGTFEEQIEAPDVHANCKLQLASATYTVNGDGSGTSTAKWQLNKSASAPACQQFSGDPRQEPSADRLISTDGTGAKFYIASLNQFAVMATVCER
jgi:hypothetical protein